MEMIDKTIFVIVGSDYSGIKNKSIRKTLVILAYGWVVKFNGWYYPSQQIKRFQSGFPFGTIEIFGHFFTPNNLYESHRLISSIFLGDFPLSLACFTFVLLPGLSLYVSFVTLLPRSLSLDPSPLSHTFSKSVLIGVLLAFVVVDGVAVVVVVVVFI